MNESLDKQSVINKVLAGGGDMGARIRSFDWSTTPVGPMGSWPQSLRTAVSILLSSRHPMFLWWGPELVQFYNDGYRPSLGAHKHPQALGQPGKICWEEIWPIIGVQIESVMSHGQETWHEDQLVPFDRNGYMEEIYFTYGYSPIRDELGNVGGTLVVCTETTRRVISERRMDTLRVLAAQMGEMLSVSETCRKLIDSLARNPADLPFSLLYLLSPDASSVSLVGSSGLDADHLVHLALIDVNDSLWTIREVIQTGQSAFISDLAERFGGHFQVGIWPEPVHSALVLPITHAGQQPYGIFIVGISSRLALDAAYDGFLNLVAGQIASAVANAHAYEEERHRVEMLAELDRAKTAFFNNISHEFRTPLTLLLAPIEDALADDSVLSGDALQMSYRNAQRLLRLVNRLLDFSRIEAGRIRASYGPVDLAGFTADLASIFRSAVERAGLEFDVECDAISEPVYVDREMWEKIVLNLLSNALKFTFTGSIRLSLQEVSGTVQPSGMRYRGRHSRERARAHL